MMSIDRSARSDVQVPNILVDQNTINNLVVCLFYLALSNQNLIPCREVRIDVLDVEPIEEPVVPAEAPTVLEELVAPPVPQSALRKLAEKVEAIFRSIKRYIGFKLIKLVSYFPGTSSFILRREIQASANGDQLLMDVHSRSIADAAYQDSLSLLLKQAFLEIHDTPKLAGFLNRDEDSGQELLTMFDASTYSPLTCYTQFKELEGEINCPEAFSGNLVEFNGRRAMLIQAKQQLSTLSPDEKELLVERILRGYDCPVEGKVKDMYRTITYLAAPLVQGPLMTKTAINLRATQSTDLIQATNLFQHVCQEAAAEIELRNLETENNS